MISWSDHIDAVGSFDDVWHAVADQHRVMRWSAWPKATGYACSVDGDGTSVGSGIVFTPPTGEKMGRQTIVSTDGGVVRNRLANRGPGGRTVEPEVDFRVEQLTPDTRRVRLDFRLQLERDVEAHAA